MVRQEKRPQATLTERLGEDAVTASPSPFLEPRLGGRRAPVKRQNMVFYSAVAQPRIDDRRLGRAVLPQAMVDGEAHRVHAGQAARQSYERHAVHAARNGDAWRTALGLISSSHLTLRTDTASDAVSPQDGRQIAHRQSHHHPGVGYSQRLLALGDAETAKRTTDDDTTTACGGAGRSAGSTSC